MKHHHTLPEKSPETKKNYESRKKTEWNKQTKQDKNRDDGEKGNPNQRRKEKNAKCLGNMYWVIYQQQQRQLYQITSMTTTTTTTKNILFFSFLFWFGIIRVRVRLFSLLLLLFFWYTCFCFCNHKPRPNKKMCYCWWWCHFFGFFSYQLLLFLSLQNISCVWISILILCLVFWSSRLSFFSDWKLKRKWNEIIKKIKERKIENWKSRNSGFWILVPPKQSNKQRNIIKRLCDFFPPFRFL